MTSVTISNQQNPVVLTVTAPGGGVNSWNALTDKPTEFPPQTHEHLVSQVTGLQATLDTKASTASPTFTGTVSGITKAMVGLPLVDNTSDANKPISNATQTALNGKANTSHSHVIGDTTGLQTALDGKAAVSHTHTASQISDSTAVGRSVVTAVDANAARSAIGAGTSNLAIGTTSTTAKAGDYQPTAANISDSTATGRSLITAADAATARAAIGAGTSNLTIGTTSTTAKAGDYQPTAANISDSTAIGRSVLTAASASAARTAIGAGTSDLAIGTTATTAKAGNYAPSLSDIPAGSTISVYWSGSAWPARPTSRTDVTVQWIGGVEASPPSAGVAGKDVWIRSAV